MKTVVLSLFFMFTSLALISETKGSSIKNAEKHLKEHNYKEAINLYSSLITSLDTVSRFYYGRGLAYYYTNQTDSAIKDFTHSIKLKSNNSSAFLGLAMAYMQNQQYQEAINVLKKRLSSDSNNVELLYCRAIAHYLDGNYQLSVDNYNNVIDIFDNPVSSELHFDFGYIYANSIYGRAIASYMLKDYDNTKLDLEHCLNKNLLTSDYINECQNLLSILNNR